MKIVVINLLREYKVCFAWDYNEMARLNRDLVELKLPIKSIRRPVKQNPRQFVQNHVKKREEIKRLLKRKFIRTTKYVEWLDNIVPIKNKNRTLRVCINFRDLNAATSKDEYLMSIAEMLIDSAAGFKFLSMLNAYLGYN